MLGLGESEFILFVGERYFGRVGEGKLAGGLTAMRGVRLRGNFQLLWNAVLCGKRLDCWGFTELGQDHFPVASPWIESAPSKGSVGNGSSSHD